MDLFAEYQRSVAGMLNGSVVGFSGVVNLRNLVNKQHEYTSKIFENYSKNISKPIEEISNILNNTRKSIMDLYGINYGCEFTARNYISNISYFQKSIDEINNNFLNFIDSIDENIFIFKEIPTIESIRASILISIIDEINEDELKNSFSFNAIKELLSGGWWIIPRFGNDFYKRIFYDCMDTNQITNLIINNVDIFLETIIGNWNDEISNKDINIAFKYYSSKNYRLCINQLKWMIDELLYSRLNSYEDFNEILDQLVEMLDNEDINIKYFFNQSFIYFIEWILRPYLIEDSNEEEKENLIYNKFDAIRSFLIVDTLLFIFDCIEDKTPKTALFIFPNNFNNTTYNTRDYVWNTDLVGEIQRAHKYFKNTEVISEVKNDIFKYLLKNKNNSISSKELLSIKSLNEYFICKYNNLSKYLDDDFSSNISDSDNLLGDYKKIKTKFIFLSIDMVGSTKLSKSMGSEYSKFISLFLDVVSSIIVDFGGNIYKYGGDEVLAFFSLFNFYDIIDNSIVCILAIKLFVENYLNKFLKENGFPSINFRIGWNFGNALINYSLNRNDIFCNALSITCKLQKMANPNSALISGAAYDFLSERGKYLLKEVNIGEKTNELDIGENKKLFTLII